jgi:hypothetical protein
MKKVNQKKNQKRVIQCNFSNDVVLNPTILAANPPMQGQPTGIQPKPGMAKSRSVGRTRLLGGSADMGGGTRMALTHAGSIVRSSDGVARVQILQAIVSLYGKACGGGPSISIHERSAGRRPGAITSHGPGHRRSAHPEQSYVCSSSCHEVWTQDSISRLLATAESVVASKH